MNRSNVGNITTNAMQTLAISGTRLASDIRHWKMRDKGDVSKSLNNSDGYGSVMEEPFPEHGFVDQNGLNESDMSEGFSYTVRDAESPDVDESDEFYRNLTEHLLPVNSPQSGSINKYIRNNLDWIENRIKGGGGR